MYIIISKPSNVRRKKHYDRISMKNSSSIELNTTSTSSDHIMDAANATGLTVLVCTMLLGIVFASVILCKARSRYSEYMLGTTSTQQQHMDQDKSTIADRDGPVIISLYPSIHSLSAACQASGESAAVAVATEALVENITIIAGGDDEELDDEVFEIHETPRYLMSNQVKK